MAQRDSALDEDPIFWTSTKPGYNDRDRERVRMIKGKKVHEKFPQMGHVGEPRNKRRAPGVRFIYMINDCGNEVPVVMTTAAAHSDSTGPFAQYQMLKARHFGWFHTGDCPCALLKTGRLTPDHIVDRRLLEVEAACEPGQFNRDEPCPHAQAEQIARQAAHKAREDERLGSYKDQGERMIEAQREQTAALIAAIQSVIADAASAKRSPEEIQAIVKAVISESKGGKGKNE